MEKCLCVAVALVLFYSVQVNAVPLVSDYDFQELDDSVIDQLIDGILNDADNVNMIKQLFNLENKKICVPIIYNICFSDTFKQRKYHIIWLKYDIKKSSTKILLQFALLNFSVVGFDWGDTCETYTRMMVNISMPSSIQSSVDVIEELKYITTLVSNSFYIILMPNTYCNLANFHFYILYFQWLQRPRKL